MALESATYINQLNAANPLGSDPIASGDDHIRLIKAALQATFPNITGPVTPTQAVLNNPFPIGGIILWSGSIVSVPSGWALCDGTNGTPNLRDRFVVGAGTTYAVGATGGSKDAIVVTHNHGGTTGYQSHNHTHNVQGWTGGQSVDHSHGFSVGRSFGAIYGSSEGVQFGNYPVNTSAAVTTGSGTGGTSTDHAHFVNLNTGTISQGHYHEITTVGSSGTNANLPPYYALAYIMKV